MFKTHLTPDSDSEALIKNLICNNLAGQFGGWKSLEELWPFDDSFNQTNPLVWLEDPQLQCKSCQGFLTPVPPPPPPIHLYSPTHRVYLNSENKMHSVKRQKTLLENDLSCVILFDPESDSKDLFYGSSKF